MFEGVPVLKGYFNENKHSLEGSWWASFKVSTEWSLAFRAYGVLLRARSRTHSNSEAGRPQTAYELAVLSSPPSPPVFPVLCLLEAPFFLVFQPAIWGFTYPASDMHFPQLLHLCWGHLVGRWRETKGQGVHPHSGDHYSSDQRGLVPLP